MFATIRQVQLPSRGVSFREVIEGSGEEQAQSRADEVSISAIE